jgi:hypothetical protein
MCQLEYIQVFYAFHFDSLPKNEHETRARFLPRSLEFSKRQNEGYFPRHEAIEAVAFLLKKADI